MEKPDYPYGTRHEKFRVMRHDCKDGSNCFEKNKRCRLGALDLLFPGNNGMSDVDGFCAINRHLVFLEWKTSGNISQLNALLELSRVGLVVVGIGPIELMKPERWWAYRRGELLTSSDKYPGRSVESFDRLIWEWSQWAMNTHSEQDRDWAKEFAVACNEKYGEPIPGWLR